MLSLSKHETPPYQISRFTEATQKTRTMPFWTYILSCQDDTFYVGHTDNLDARISQHQYGEFPGYTRSRLPVRLVYSVEAQTRDDAFSLERKIKGWSRAKKQALIDGDFGKIRNLARNRASSHASTSSA